jgi:hypothetical protein
MPDAQWFLDRAVKCLALAGQLKDHPSASGLKELGLDLLEISKHLALDAAAAASGSGNRQ